MELAKPKVDLSPDYPKDAKDEALTPSTQDNDCICCLLCAKSPEFDQDITTTHSIMNAELKLAKELNKILKCKLNKQEQWGKTAINKKKYDQS